MSPTMLQQKQLIMKRHVAALKTLAFMEPLIVAAERVASALRGDGAEAEVLCEIDHRSAALSVAAWVPSLEAARRSLAAAGAEIAVIQEFAAGTAEWRAAMNDQRIAVVLMAGTPPRSPF